MLRLAYLSTLLAGCLAAGVALADPPLPPEVVLPEGATGPGEFPNKGVSAANWLMDVPAGVMNGGDNQDQIRVSIPQSGAVKWSTPRYNEGDVAIRLAPFDPVAATELLGTDFPWEGSDNPNDFRFGQTDQTTPIAQAWRPDGRVGFMAATVRSNYSDWDDGLDSGYYGTIAAHFNSSAYGYSMLDGTYGTGGSDVSVGGLGPIEETNVAFATAWFPYEQGWTAGYFNGPDAEGLATWQDERRSFNLETVEAGDLMTWIEPESVGLSVDNASGPFGGYGKLSLASLDVNSINDGLLFTISADGGSATNITAASPLDDGSGWLISNRNDQQDNPLFMAEATESAFGFLYVPYDAHGLVGGRVDGDTGTAFKSSGAFNLTHAGEGTYELTIAGKTGNDGMLLLNNSDMLSTGEAPDWNNLTYEFDAQKNAFVIQARHFDGDFPLENTDFSFAWVDFTSPLSLTSPSLPGDINLDGKVDLSDFGILKENFGTGTTQAQGDLNSDAKVDLSDFGILKENFGKVAGAAVPEPSTLLLLTLGGLAALVARRARR
jgi:hypothetical protein